MRLHIMCLSCILGVMAVFGLQSSAQEFAGSQRCKACHLQIYEQYTQTGHPHKIQKITDVPPAYPANTSPGVPQPPAGKTWKDITYVIGGFGWKARFLDNEGYILTGKERQYNLANPLHGNEAHWVAYDSKNAPRKPYTCGTCHTTGWVATGAAGPHQDGLPGIHGTWAEPGVTCEACHGPSAAHVAAPTRVKPSSEERCGTCHARGDVTRIDASGGLVKHHEQYEDLLASPHKALACGTCHAPHQSTKYQTGGYKGVERTCKTCHADVQVKIAAKANVACSTCHMPFAVKSAVSTMVSYVGGSVPKGDIRSHIQRISTNPQWTMFTDDGKFVRVDSHNKAYLTLDYVCMSCHTTKDMAWAMTQAQRIH